MHLKNLTLLGFKSFPEKTVLEFRPGITAVVGPNGCGKSNVADAIRWVLGEQSAKALRGGEMADVIFNGTDQRKPLSLAEVSLTVGGVETEHLRAAGVELNFSEVTLTRRVFRDGGSEYFVNGVPCRLKDIQQLFMGTGVGRTSYSIMAQGNITQVLSSNPVDRRMVFEEAAGITRFKTQRRETLRKLESTEQNMLRLEDLIREVKRQLIVLQRQAGKARRYRQYQQQLQQLETQLARHQLDLLLAEIAARTDAQQQLRQQLETGAQEVMGGEETLGQLRERLVELEHELGEAQQQAVQLRAEAERHEHRIHYNDQRRAELAAQSEQAAQDIAAAEERRLATEADILRVEEQLRGSLARLAEQRQALRERQGAVQEVETGLREQEEALRQTQAEAFANGQQLSRARNEINALDLQKQGNAIRLEKLSAEKAQLEEERSRLELRLDEFARQAEAERQTVQAHRLSVEEQQQRLRDLQAEILQVGQELDALQHEAAEKRSRLEVLEQLQSSHEGFGPGALAALRDSREILGTLADRIRVPDPFVGAVEAALGQHLQLLLTERPESAHDILAHLGAARKGRASIASLDLLGARNGGDLDQSPATAAPPLPDGFGETAGQPLPARVAAVSVVQADASVQALVHCLLRNTVIVPDLCQATAAWQEDHGRTDFVTHSGELLSRHGVYTGGAVNGAVRSPASILGRRNQIAELQGQCAALQEKVLDRSRRKGALQSEITALQSALSQSQTDLRAEEVAMATRQGERNALETALRVLHQKIDTVVYEIRSLAAQQQEGEGKRGVLTAQLQDLEQRENALQQTLAGLNAQTQALRQQRDLLQAALTEAKVALAGEEQVCASLRQQQRPLEERRRELTEALGQRRRDQETFQERSALAETEIAESRLRLDGLRQEQEQAGLRVSSLAEQREAYVGAIATAEDVLRARRRSLAGLQEQKSALDIELTQKQMSAQNVRDRMREKYQVNLDDVRSECITITFAADGPPKIVTVSPEEMAAAGVATDWDAVAEQAGALQTRIDEMGPVNVVAIEEFEATEQRHKFLTDQHQDLVRGRQQLVDAMNQLNAQTREMFTATFAKIRENFRTMFAEVFGGGKADLFLVDEGDVLESGIEIEARPPGKQLQRISLLSGGEQTMTAVALLFAIYQVKPSPFCVLDELDAPLDESNINRFVRILQRFLGQSQFIIITHSKRTIGMADVLYGLTMQEQGVSKIVSVKFHKAGEQVLDYNPEPLDAPAPLGDDRDNPRPRRDSLELAVAG